ncbi:hypothetical protein SO802_014958 [Lithocarpus litseifolius]|uniref:F-box domain-containing protein n=1 Tax=Lithocarpus litseifolius TaxID=425828 RepID=A0AAW2CSE6_9ROSI
MWDSPPPEILTFVLIRLPIKSIITCTSVSKTWKSIIQNPSFISVHLHHSKNKHPLLLFRLPPSEHRISDKELYSLFCDNNNNPDLYEHTRFDFPLSGTFRVVGTCNGLVCFAMKFTDRFFFWNPLVRKLLILPTPSVGLRTLRFYNPSIGFGFDSKTNDYKVVRIVSASESESSKVPKVEVYSLATAQWRVVTAVPPTGTAFADKCDPHAFVNGALHCVASKNNFDNEILNFILVFDLGDEVFREIAMPKPLDNPENVVGVSVSAYRNSLALIQWGVSICCVDIWVMKWYAVASSWTKMFSTLADQGGFLPRPIGFKNGEVLLEMHKGQFVSRDLETQQIKDHRTIGDKFTFVDSYVESLVLLNKPNCAFAY